ncbi:MAG: NlpC/P60 family protein [Akkermansiaceae bacterium]
MKNAAPLALLLTLFFWGLGSADELARPKTLAKEDLKEFTNLPDAAKKRIATALAVSKKHNWLRYKFGSADPVNKGFDCSGAMNYVLSSLKYEIPRTSSDQYLWLKENKSLNLVPETVRSLDDHAFDKLSPGDLVFWSGTYEPTDGRTIKITHVGMYLGTEKKDGRPVMICSSKGRSYRRVAADGYGVFDFRVPGEKSKARIVGFGTPPKPEK